MAQRPGQLASNAAYQAHIASFESGALEKAPETVENALDLMPIREAANGKGLSEMFIHRLDFGNRRQARDVPIGRSLTGLHDLIADHHDRLGQIERRGGRDGGNDH